MKGAAAAAGDAEGAEPGRFHRGDGAGGTAKASSLPGRSGRIPAVHLQEPKSNFMSSSISLSAATLTTR